MFSELIDECVHVAGRPDCLVEFIRYANETMRDLNKRSDWVDDLLEEEYTPQPGTPAIWVPEVGRTRFRRELFVEDACGCQLTATRPSRRQQKLEKFYYRTGDSFAFKTTCFPVKIAYYAYVPWLRYYPANARPSTFDPEIGEYTDLNQIDLVSNWLLERHYHVVMDGTLARFFKTKLDQRQQVQFSAYEQGVQHMIRGEHIGQVLGQRTG